MSLLMSTWKDNGVQWMAAYVYTSFGARGRGGSSRSDIVRKTPSSFFAASLLLNPPPILVLGFISVFHSMRVTSNGPKNKVQDPRPARAGETRL